MLAKIATATATAMVKQGSFSLVLKRYGDKIVVD
jgi:hypothetical protein